MATSDKSKEEALPQVNDRFRLLFESVADALLLHDLAGRFVEVNQAACESLGYTREEILQLPFPSIVKEGDPEALGVLWARVLQGEKLTLKGFHQRRDGTAFPVEVHLSPFAYEGRPHILASARDISTRREAEKALQDSTEKYRRLQANIPGMVYVYALHPDGSYSFPYVNAASRELFDIAPEDLMRDGALLAELIHPDDRERRDEAIRRSAATLQPFREELRHIVNGKVRWYDVMSRPELQPNGDVLWDGIMLEITERKQAEAALAESEQRFSTFMEHLPAAVFIKDQAGRLVFANRYLRDTFGWQDCLGKTTAELLPQEMAEKMIADDRRVLAAGPILIQEKITDIQGSERFFDTCKFPINAEDASPLVGGIAVDVTDRYCAEEALQTEKLLTEAILDSLPATFFLLDSQGKQLRTNRSEMEITGYSWEELANMHALESIAEEDRPAAQSAIEEVLEKGEASLEARMLTKDGRKIPFFFTAKKFIIDDTPYILGSGLDITAHKQAEEALQKEKLFTEAILDSLPGTFFLLDSQGQLKRSNKSGLAISGFSEEELSQMHALEALAEEDRPAAQCALEEVFEKGETFIEAQLLTKDGRKIPFLFTAKKFVIDGVPFILGCGVDITARKQMEEALRESRALFQDLVETAQDLIWQCDFEGRYTYLNPAWEEAFGYKIEEMLGKRFTDFQPPEYAARDQQEFARLLQGNIVKGLETVHLAKNGKELHLVFNAKVIRDKDGLISGTRGTAYNITKRKLGEEALRESEERYRNLFQNHHTVMFLVDPETGAFMDANPAACAYYGFSKEELLTKTTADLNTLTPDQVFQAMQRAKAEKQKYFQFQHRLASGEVRDVEVFSGPIRVKGRELLYSIVHDVTARKEVEKALQASEARFRQVVESSPLPIGLSNADGTIAYVNPKFVETFGYTLEDVPRLGDWYRLAYPDPAYRQNVLARWQKVMEKITNGGGASENIESKIICKDGSKRIMEIFGAQMGSQILAIFNDLTERKRMEEALEKRLVALSRPLGDVADIEFQDLFNLEEIQRIQDLFAKSTGVSSLITGPEGTPITRPSNFTRLCGSYIRQTEEGRKKCSISDAVLGRYSPDGPIIQHCLSAGLCGAGASITVGGKHIANWLIGQVRDETVNEEKIRDYARDLRVNEEEFIAAFREVPAMPEDQFKLVAQALFIFANQLSAMAYQNVQQARFITERKQAEERLLAIQERLELALQGADLGTWDWNAETGAISVNKRWVEMLGYTLEEIKPHFNFWEKLVHPDDLPAVMEVLNAHLEGQIPFFETEHRLRHKSGSWVWVLDKGKVIERDALGKAVRACGTHLDITERKRAEVALRDSEERLRLALQAANQGLYDLNIQTGEAKVSPEYATMLGYDPGEFQETNERWIERLHPDEREQVAATYQAYVRGDIPSYEVEFRQRTQSGDWKWILSLGKVAAWDEDGKPLRMLGTHTDITERKQAEEALRESERRLREAQEMAHLGFWHWNVKTGEVTWSEEVYKIFQLDPQEFTPHIDSIMELSPWPEDHERDQELIRQAMESHEKGAFEQRFLLPDKSIGYYYSTFQGKYDDGGKLIFIVGTVLDITARKRAEEERAKLEAQMREVQKLESMGILAGGIAHDFNNLLMAILGNADLALLALSPASPARPNVEEITRASLRAADLCRQMLAYSGKGRFVVGRYDLSEIVREMTQILEVSVSKKATLRYSFAADLPAVEVDATQIRQVIMNLITNAAEALGDRSGIISVSTGVMNCDRAYLAQSYLDDNLPEGEYVYLEVADTGSGIDEETRRRIFDPFFTTKFTGRGLGLAAVLGIVRGHQGAIKVYSEVGHGTIFKVLLPAQEWALRDQGASPVPSVKPIPGGGTILLIDDDPEVRDVGIQMLERLGFKVLTAAHGQEGLKIFQECGGEIDCVILDLTMPEMSGEEVFRELRRLRSDLRVILSSGYNEQDVTQRFAGKGLAGFIQKPYRVVNLQEILNRVLD